MEHMEHNHGDDFPIIIGVMCSFQPLIFQGVLMDFYVTLLTEPLEEEIPFGNHHFQVPC